MLASFIAGVISAWPRAVACATCFGQSDSPMAKAMNLGILLMLGVVVVVLVSFASFFVYLSRRARLAAGQTTATPVTPLHGGPEPGPRPAV